MGLNVVAITKPDTGDTVVQGYIVSKSAQLRQLAGILEKATPGPWFPISYQDDKTLLIEGSHPSDKGMVVDIAKDLLEYDAQAICASRNSTDLLRKCADKMDAEEAEVERLERLVKQAVRLIKSALVASIEEIGGKIYTYDPDTLESREVVLEPELAVELLKESPSS